MKVVSDLIQEAAENDPTGSVRDFSRRKAISFEDPYNEETHFAHLKYEDEIRMRASLVVDVKKTELEELKTLAAEGALSFTDKERLS